MARPRIGISRCLLGDNVRYDGGNKRNSMLLALFGLQVEWIPICPEVEVGMGTPREPIHLVAAPDLASGAVRLVGLQSGADWTRTMSDWSHTRIGDLASLELSGYILKADSPTCGLDDVPISTGAAVSLSGRGMFADALVRAFPDLPVDDERRLADPARAVDFLARVRAYSRSH